MSLTDQGFTALRTADFVELIQSEYITEAGLPEGTDLSSDTLLGVFVGVIAARLDAVSQATQAVYDAFTENASGAQLDNVNRLRGVNRNIGTRSRVPGTLTGTVDATIAAGVVLQGGGTDGSARWTTLESVTLTGGSAVVTLQAEDVGPTTVDPGTAQIVTPRAGLDSATFDSPVTLGTPREADDVFRLRGALSIAAAGAHTVNALLSAVLAVDGVTDAFFIDNPDTVVRTISGISVPARSSILYVLPNPLSSTVQTALLDAIADNFLPGTLTAATDVTRTETHEPTGSSYVIGFDYGTELSATIVATLTLASGTAQADAIASLQELVTAFVATLRMGDPLTQLQLCGLALQVDGVTDASFTIDGSSSLTPNADQKIATATVSAA